ncbi:hypothetical protein [Pseudonocardia sp. GCM10023141]|uniref:hypothetical protein n=1 Tax=Pseudonocardia sp. GCM10023141 TaxID=3252653 RepID=UPI00360EBE92
MARALRLRPRRSGGAGVDAAAGRAWLELRRRRADDEEGTFGLATMRREHVRLHRGAVEFSYPAKGG